MHATIRFGFLDNTMKHAVEGTAGHEQWNTFVIL